MDENQIAYLDFLQYDSISKKWNGRLRKETINHPHMTRFQIYWVCRNHKEIDALAVSL
ncbi:hypothetical protein LINPERPRIM_LOCUS19555 [Linum perenne]